MRMMLKVQLDTANGNAAIKDGRLAKVIQNFMGQAKPEAAYFTVEGGRRTAFFFFDMKDSASMPPLGEDMYMELGADLAFIPVMNAEELQAGLGAYMASKK